MPKTKQMIAAREAEVLEGILAGKTYAQIANSLGIGHETVKTYANRIRAKAGVSSREDLAAWAEAIATKQPGNRKTCTKPLEATGPDSTPSGTGKRTRPASAAS